MMSSYYVPGSAVLVLCPRTQRLLPRTVQEHLIVGPRAGTVIVQKSDGQVERWPVEAVHPATSLTAAA